MSDDNKYNNLEKIPLSQIPWRDYIDSKKYAKSIDDMCGLCIENQKARFGAQNIQCRGLATASSFLPESASHMFSEDEMEQLEQIVNPHYWALKNLKEGMWNEDRWYQEQMVRCTARYRTYRCGRRTGKSYSLALNILHKVLTNENYKVLVVTPYEVQAEELFNYIKDFLYNMKPEYGSYDELVKKDVKSPTFFLQFANNSRVRGFTTGSSGAGSVRGQSAHLIVLDEVDYMTDDDFNSITAILADNPETELWVASTPNGKKSLYKLEQIDEYKAFHYPTFVLPHYDDNLDKRFREQSTDVGFIQEFMAEFGVSEAGVFQSYHVDRNTFDNVEREHVKNNPDRFIRILGCDWNSDRIGTRLVAVAFDKVNKKCFVFDRRTVTKEGWTQVAAVEEIIRMNREYKFDHMYLDEGFGTSQIQFMKQYAIDQYGKLPADHPDLKLADVVGINFSSKVETRDVATGVEDKKDMKNYMVDNAIRYLERDFLIFDREYDMDLLQQMGNYIIARRTPTGKPVYAAEEERIGDHDLDAYMLALLGFSMEYSQFLNVQTSDVIVELVSRDKMSGQEKSDEDPFGLEQENLFAYSGGRKRVETMFNNKFSGYNRSTFGDSYGNSRTLTPGKMSTRKVNRDGYSPTHNDIMVRFSPKNKRRSEI